MPIPFQLYFVALEKVLLRDRCREIGNVKDFDGGRVALNGLSDSQTLAKQDTDFSFGDEHSHRIGLSWGDGEVLDPFNAKLVPHGPQITAFVELYFVCNHTGAELLVSSILEVPTCLGLLHEPAHNVAIIGSLEMVTLDDPPDCQILDCIPTFSLRWPLPSDDESAQRREAKLVDVLNVQ